MIREYPKELPQRQSVPLPSEFYPLTGRLVRAFAEIEELLSLSLAFRLGVNEDAVKVLLGKQSYPALAGLLGTVANGIGPDLAKSYRDIFDTLEDLKTIRNILSHSTYIGRDQTDTYWFKGRSTLKIEDAGRFIMEEFGLTIPTVEAAANQAERFVDDLPSLLQLEAWLETRPQRLLWHHPKAPNTRQKYKGQKPRRKSSLH